MGEISGMLPWLCPPPEQFRAEVKAIERASTPDLAALRRIAATAMDFDQLRRFAKLVDTSRDALDAAGFTPIRLGLVGSHTLDFVPDALAGSAIRHGIQVRTVQAAYGQVMQSVLDPASPLAAEPLDAVLIALDAQTLGLARSRLDPQAAQAAVDAAIAKVAGLCDGVRSVLGSVPLFQTLPLPADPLFGAFDLRLPGSVRSMVDQFNRRLAGEVLQPGDLLVDVALAAAEVGLDRWYDQRGWHSAKLPFSLDVMPLYADHVCRVLGAFKGKARKCLVLDLDNTLWGGIIGDDGLDGIRLGQGDAIGEAHLAIQQLALDLRDRGIILAVCSKNDDANARAPFRDHRDMALREDHIACFVANWQDKATNLRNIAATLNIGTDALVFLDDNPAERAIVRRELPEVAVPEVGDDPALYPARLARAGYFEAIAFADEDRQRADMYQANASRLQAASASTNMADYLASLDMRLTARPFDSQGRSRIAQLINKSNQFNLTTRRYSEAEVAAIEADPRKFAMQIRLTDTFGDNGMISVVIFDRGDDAWACDTWLMSCRVLGRKVEQAVLAIVAQAARRAGAVRLLGTYLPSPKNALVRDHFATLGFAPLGSDAMAPPIGNFRSTALRRMTCRWRSRT